MVQGSTKVGAYYRRLAEIFEPKIGEEREERKRTLPFFLFFIALWVGFVFISTKMEVKIEEETIQIEKLPERFAKIIVPKLVEERKKAEAAGEKGKKKVKKKKAEKPKVQKAEQKTAERPAATAEQKREVIRKKVRTVGVLALLTAKGEGGSPISEILGGGVVQNLDEVLAGISGVQVAEEGEELKPLALAGGKLKRRKTDVGELAARGGREVKLGGKKVVRVRSRIATESPEIEGELDAETVRRIYLKNQASIKYCFTKAQMRNPNLQGKIVVSITIGETGRVIDVSVEESTIDDPDMISCVLRMVRRWKFPATGGEVTITLPLVFISMT